MQCMCSHNIQEGDWVRCSNGLMENAQLCMLLGNMADTA